MKGFTDIGGVNEDDINLIRVLLIPELCLALFNPFLHVENINKLSFPVLDVWEFSGP